MWARKISENDVMKIAEEAAQIPVEWVDADEWEAIEQALAAAAHFARNDAPAGANLTPCGTRDEHSNEPREKNEEEHPNQRTGRTLPAWGQKNVREAGTSPAQALQVHTKIEEKPQASSVEVKPVAVQTNLHQLTDPWAIARTTFQNKVKVQSRSLSLQFKGRLIYSKTYSEVDEAAHAIWEIIGARREISPGNVAVGFDLEWRTLFQRGGTSGKVALVQLCLDSGRCDVMQVVHSGIPPSLATILEDPSILKAGVGTHGDAAKLQRDYGIQTRGVVDLSEMARQKLARGWQSWSLSSLAEELTCKKVDKVPGIRCGDWEACPLSPPQLQYAATDAFASLHLYQILETFSNRVFKNEESGSGSTLMQQGFT